MHFRINLKDFLKELSLALKTESKKIVYPTSFSQRAVRRLVRLLSGYDNSRMYDKVVIFMATIPFNKISVENKKRQVSKSLKKYQMETNSNIILVNFV